MPMSRMATSGFNLLARSTASRPFAASPQIFHPLLDSKRARRPLRTTPWSSATRMRTDIVDLAAQRQHRLHRRSPGARADLDPATELPHPLPHAEDPDTEWALSNQFLLQVSGRHPAPC